MRQYVLAANQNTKNFLIWPEEFFRGPVSKQVSAPPWLWMLDKFNAAIKGSYGGEGGGSGTEGWRSMGARKMRKFIAPIIDEAVQKWQVDKYWILSTIAKESGFQAVNDGRIPSPKGQISRGLMQVNTDLFWDMIKLLRKEGHIPSDVPDTAISYNDPKYNIYAGVRYARLVMDKCGVDPAKVNRQNLFFDPAKPINDTHVFICGYGGGIGKGQAIKKAMLAGKKLGDLSRSAHSNPGSEGWQNFLERVTARMAKAWDAIKADDQQTSNSEDPNAELTEVAGGDVIAEALAEGEGGGQSEDPTANEPPKKQIPDPSTTQQKAEPQQSTSQASQPDYYDPAKQSQTATQPISDPKAQAGASDTSQSIDATVAGMSESEQDALGQLFDIYAQYEYFRSRYEKRVGATIMAFNPYVIPAFPAVLFDSKYSGISTIGYIMNVRHQMSAQAGAPAMMTTVNTAFQRTLPEFLGDMRMGWDAAFWDDRPYPYSCFPIEPIQEVASIFQQLTMANDFYGKLLYNKRMSVPAPENKMEIEAKKEADVFSPDSLKGQSNPNNQDAAAGATLEQTFYDPEVAAAATRRDRKSVV
jgi:hypothetical protein